MHMDKIMKRHLLFRILSLATAVAATACSGAGGGTSITSSVPANEKRAASCSQGDVQAAVASAVNGDTVILPACACGDAPAWTSKIVIPAQITIQGSGIQATCIQDGGFWARKPAVGGANNWTVRNILFSRSTWSVPPLVIGENTDTGTPVTGWMITGIGVTGYPVMLLSYNGSTGLVTNSTFTVTGSAAAEILQFYGNEGADWASPSSWGSAGTYVFIEDNTFACSGSAANACLHAAMASRGASMVDRCNWIVDTGANTSQRWYDVFDVHGYGYQGGSWRSGRQLEVYGNKHTKRYDSGMFVSPRGGSYRIFKNLIVTGGTSTYADGIISLGEWRAMNTGNTMMYPLVTGPAVCSSQTATTACAVQKTCCADHEGYPCCDQLGRGAGQTADPAFAWDNTDDSSNLLKAGFNGSASPNGCDAACQVFIQAGRDYFDDGTLPAGYAPYTYPHPARGLAAATTCRTTGITFWRP